MPHPALSTPVHGSATLTIGAVDAGVLVVAEEEATVALALVATQGVHADLLAAAIVVQALVHVCGRENGHEFKWSCPRVLPDCSS